MSLVTHNIYTIHAHYDTKYCSFDRFFGKKIGHFSQEQGTDLNMVFKELI